ncbi:CLUMA_CG008770, isoform A [Clunio marinus]|uniref:CLUMA_CG008770, isoform A n=1 Tax=Clunio marinus TaxID=568069 RepID=A0A1J1I8A1_9DIPT|nr:CLUMA_CG008770, isoform A [Clunio marinus]
MKCLNYNAFAYTTNANKTTSSATHSLRVTVFQSRIADKTFQYLNHILQKTCFIYAHGYDVTKLKWMKIKMFHALTILSGNAAKIHFQDKNEMCFEYNELNL